MNKTKTFVFPVDFSEFNQNFWVEQKIHLFLYPAKFLGVNREFYISWRFSGNWSNFLGRARDALSPRRFKESGQICPRPIKTPRDFLADSEKPP